MIKINKFLAASVVTLSLAACDLAPYSSMAVYADQAAKVVCDERYWVAARSGPGTEYELEHKLSNGKDITILEQTTGADGKVWYKAKYNLAANNEECVSYIRSDFVSAGTGTAASDNAQTGEASADTGNADAIQQNNEEQLALATASGVYATGTITGGNVYVRNAAGTSGTTKVVSLNWNHQVDIIGETRVNGVVWYNVKGTLNGKAFTGWTISTYIKVTYNNSGDNTDFVTAMKNAGFPDSYIPNLTALHNKYPSWTFEAVNTGLDWNTVIKMRVSMDLIWCLNQQTMPRNRQLPEPITGQQIRGLSTNRDGCQQAVPILLISWIQGIFLMRPIFFSFRVWHTVRMRHLKVSSP